jgi:hypothetical protein
VQLNIELVKLSGITKITDIRIIDNGSKFINHSKLFLLMSTGSLSRATAELVQEYFKWFCSFPKSTNPALHNDGDRSIVANKSPIKSEEYIFLSTVLSGPSQRKLGIVKKGKKILIPSLSCIASASERPGSQVPQLEKFADIDHDNIVYRSIEIDGKPLVGDLESRFRVRTKDFEVEYPNNAIFGVSKGLSKAVADGVYIVWEPPEGEHEIHFEGKIDTPEDGDSLETRDYVENVTYNFKVE